MSKYRKQMLNLMVSQKEDEIEPVLEIHQTYSNEVEGQIDRICAMGDVMRRAVQIDDDESYKVQEKLAQLELENKELHEVLSVSRESLKDKEEELSDQGFGDTSLHNLSPSTKN